MTCRSTPEYTFAYVAVAPETVGVGRAEGQAMVSVRLSAVMVARVVPPPPERVSGWADTAGE